MSDKLGTMRSRFTLAMAAYSDSREDELDDLKFRAGSPDNQWQWPTDVLSSRGAVQGQAINARPCLTINKLPQHVLQVTNDQRQNRPSGKVIPADGEGDVEIAEVFDGIVRHIEYISDADVAYDTACDNQVTYGEGYIRILTEFCSDASFDQDIKIGRIRNSFSVYMDPAIQDPCGADAKWCFVTQDMDKAEYEQTFPDAAPISTLMANGVGDPGLSSWIDQETVRIAEYFYFESTSATLNLYPGNLTAYSDSREAKAYEAQFGAPVKTRTVQRKKVMWMKTNGHEVLEENEWAGKYIPIVRVIGNEFEVDGQIYISGLVRNAKDAQRMYNYWPLALDTRIPTPDGWSTIQEISVGDQVFDENGAPCSVVAKSPVYIGQECFRVTFDDGSYIDADANHQWSVEERGKRKAQSFDWSSKTVSTLDLKSGRHFISVSKPIKSASNVELDPYFLGVWLGDGDTINPQITQGAEDVEPLRELLAARGLNVGLARKSHTAFRFTVHGVRAQMVRMGLIGRKFIPQEYLRASVDDRLALLRGMMDTDGSVSKNGQCSYTTVLPALFEGLSELLHSLGVKFNTVKRVGALRKFPSGNSYECQDSWQFSFTLREDMTFFGLPRKASAKKNIYHSRRNTRFGVRSIKPIASVPVQCITVDNESHLFLAGDSMVPTHNCSQEAEMLALAPKAPFIGYGGQFEGYENQWKTANTTNWPYLEVNPDVTDGAGNSLPLPQRATPPMPQAGLIQAKMGAADDIKGTTGQYDASLGSEANEKSGVAIKARQRQTDTGTYHFVDNLSRAIRYVTRQLVDIIPKIYDTERVARIIGEDGNVSMVKTNPMQQEPVRKIQDPNGGVIEKIYNLGVGTYDVMVTTGPSYMTKRQESLAAMADILQTNPQLWSVAGDLFIKNMDWPGAQEMADRFKKILDPKVLATTEDTPELAAAKQQIQALSQELNQASTIMEHIQDSVEQQRIQNEQFKTQIMAFDAETKRIAATAANMTPEQIQEIVMGTMHAAMASGDLMPPAPQPEGTPDQPMAQPNPMEAQ